ncbi:MAG: tetratricopeptide repeat protein [Candidatus Riflebacteria bacterium]
MLAASPWLVTTASEDPFLMQGWVLLTLATLCISELAVVFLFFRPRKGHFAFFSPLLLLFLAISASLFFSPYINSMRVSLIWSSYLIILAFLRLSRSDSDNLGIGSMFSFAGTAMAVYSLFQWAGYDFFHWNSSPYSMVGTFSNPNFLGAYLMLTSVYTVGMAMENHSVKPRGRLLHILFFFIQATALLLCGSSGAIIGLVLGLALYSTCSWEVRPGRILKVSPFLSGAIICVVLLLIQAIVFYSTSTYPWENLSKSPKPYFSVISRLVVWQMGFNIFLTSPLTGIGPGVIRYLMPPNRPPLGTALGLKIMNDDPHSIIVSLLAETGVSGFFAAASLLACLLGIGIWRRTKTCRAHEEDAESNEISFSFFSPGYSLFVPVLVTVLAYGAGFFDLRSFYYSIPAVIAFHGIFICLDHSEKKRKFLLARAPLVTVIVLVFHSTFNNNLHIIPLMLNGLLVASLLLSNSLKPVKWKRRFSFTALPYLCLPVLFVFCAYNLYGAYQKEQLMLFNGNQLLASADLERSQSSFEAALRANPQSLRAFLGLSKSLKRQGLLDDARNTLEKLDQLVPNAYNSNFEMARILLEHKHVLEAHKYALKALNWNTTPQSYELLGRILLLEGKYSEAEKIFEEGLIFIPEYLTEERLAADRIRLNLAALAANNNDLEKCRQYIDQIRTTISESSDVLFLKGMLLTNAGKDEEALPLFEKALVQSPENPKIMNAVGFILTRQNNDLDRAQQLLESAHNLIQASETPMLSDLLMVAHSLGMLYWKRGKIEEAGKLLQIAWEECPAEWTILKETRLKDLELFRLQNNRPVASYSIAIPATQTERLKTPDEP